MRRFGLLLAVVRVTVPAAHAQDVGKFFDSVGMRIHYTDQGDGVAVVLIHGVTGSLNNWTRTGIAPALVTEGYRVIALDARGHGESDKPHDSGYYGAHMAEDVLRLMDHLQVPRAHVIGYSMGARLTGYLLANHPDRLLSATLGASPPRRRWDPERAREFTAQMEARVGSEASSGQDFTALAAIPSSWEAQVVTDEQLGASRVPTLAIVGSEDPRLSGLEDLKHVIPALKLILIDGATRVLAGGPGVHRSPRLTTMALSAGTRLGHYDVTALIHNAGRS